MANAIDKMSDGEWHQWLGGECPFDPDARVEVKLLCGDTLEGVAADFDWHGFKEFQSSGVIAFRVLDLNLQPREFWIVPGQNPLAPIFESIEAAEAFAARCSAAIGLPMRVFHVREVAATEDRD
ncbi:hypothetical protein [Paracoccus hibiscisoli]|uniref:hypothetical protein n=1 Tax=Paracoccus hibiscisoli TaxID=2023261 RepID=UPI0023F505B1|nr:hypothetical protein [Paracoccus hibiscisoli]